MKYALINPNFTEDYGKNLIAFYGKDAGELKNPPDDSLQDPTALDNMSEAAQLYLSILDKPTPRICTIVDCDVDGFTSSAILYLYTKRICPNAEITYKLHTAKQHGLEDMIDEIEGEKTEYDIVMLPDAGSNDYDYHRRLRDIGIDVIVLDHHEALLSDTAIVVNNQLSPNYINKQLTGAGVVYQFCRYLDRCLNVNYADDYVDLAALGIISDMGSVLEIENRYIIKKGLEKKDKNFFFQTILDKQAYSIGSNLNGIAIQFYVTPLINALIRVGSSSEKEKLFLAFIDGHREVPSTKRGEKGLMENLATQMARTCDNAKRNQNKTKEQAVENLNIRIFNDELDSNKILIVLLQEDDLFDSTLNGLIAMQLSAQYKKPTLVLRQNTEGYARGSARGLNDNEFNTFKDYLEGTGLFEYVAGHQNAFGASIKVADIPKLINRSNEELSKYDFNNNFYSVNFIRDGLDKDIKNIIFDIDDYKELWGQGNPEPLIAVKNIDINSNEVNVCGANKDTVRFNYNGITYIQFHAKKLIEDISRYPKIRMEVIGRMNVNEWGGNCSPQIIITNYNIENYALTF